jgi:hypothetical protein
LRATLAPTADDRVWFALMHTRPGGAPTGLLNVAVRPWRVVLTRL